jgi:hypothetical protein
MARMGKEDLELVEADWDGCKAAYPTDVRFHGDVASTRMYT